MRLAHQTESVREAVNWALSPEVAARRERNKKACGLEEQTGPTASAVEALAVTLDQFAGELAEPLTHGASSVEKVAFDLAQNASTTTSAIALLLKHGYVADAEARWRGLHELACTAALIAQAADTAATASRYLVHGSRVEGASERLAEWRPWAAEPDFKNDYEWLRASYPNLKADGTRRSFRQAWLFQYAPVGCAPFVEWIKPSHSTVHMSSKAIVQGSYQAEAAPAGFSISQLQQVAWQVGCSAYELGTNVCLLLAEDRVISLKDAAARMIGWAEELRLRVSEIAAVAPPRPPGAHS